MGRLAFYANYFATWLSHGNLMHKGKISLIGLKPSYGHFWTHRNITKVWCITDIPTHFDYRLYDLISEKMFALYPDIKLVFYMHSLPVSVDVTSRAFKNKMDEASTTYSTYKEVFDTLPLSSQLAGHTETTADGGRIKINKETLQSLEEYRDSIFKLYSSVQQGQSQFDSHVFVQASAPNKNRIQQFTKSFINLLASDELQVEALEITTGISEYLSVFAPGASGSQTYNKKKFPRLLLNEEHLTLFMPKEQEGLTNKDGILMGVNQKSKLPFFLNFEKSGAAQVILITGKSGSGKTYNADEIAINFCHRGKHGSVFDIKGNEWEKLLSKDYPGANGHPLIQGQKIAVSGENSCFVNTLRLDDIKCSSETASEMFEYAVFGTINLFLIATNLQINEGNEEDLVSILDTAVRSVLKDVRPNDPSTFVKTANLHLSNVLEAVIELQSSKAYTLEQRELCQKVISRCDKYFGKKAAMSGIFKRELTLGDVINCPFNIYAFDKNVGSVLTTLDNLRMFMCSFLDTKKQHVRKQEGKDTFVIHEELQRCTALKYLMQDISSKVTGSRSENVYVMLLTNSISVFNREELEAIKSNITTKICGKLEESDIKLLVSEFGCESIEEDLELLRVKPDKYAHCFACMYDTGDSTGTALYKTFMPSEMESILATRDYQR